MSCVRGCEFFEIEPGKWFVLLAEPTDDDDDDPRDLVPEDDESWEDGESWYEEAEAYGPFISEEDAERHISTLDAPNYGSARVIRYTPGLQLDPDVAELIARATK